MPAILMPRLKAQITLLDRKFANPPEFTRALRDLFELYANRVYRPGQAAPPASRLPAYHVPPLVILQLQNHLRPRCLTHPAETLALIDALWAEPQQEPRLLAADLLGRLPITFSTEVISRLQCWCTPAEDHTTLQALLDSGTLTLRRQNVQLWLTTLQSWLGATEPSVQTVGLLALLPLINDPLYPNLPAIFTAASPLLQTCPPDLQSGLQDLLEALIRRSPVETGFFLRQLLMMSTAPGLTRLVRRVFNLLTPSAQTNLRPLLQARQS